MRVRLVRAVPGITTRVLSDSNGRDEGDQSQFRPSKPIGTGSSGDAKAKRAMKQGQANARDVSKSSGVANADGAGTRPTAEPKARGPARENSNGARGTTSEPDSPSDDKCSEDEVNLTNKERRARNAVRRGLQQASGFRRGISSLLCHSAKSASSRTDGQAPKRCRHRGFLQGECVSRAPRERASLVSRQTRADIRPQRHWLGRQGSVPDRGAPPPKGSRLRWPPCVSQSAS